MISKNSIESQIPNIKALGAVVAWSLTATLVAQLNTMKKPLFIAFMVEVFGCVALFLFAHYRSKGRSRLVANPAKQVSPIRRKRTKEYFLWLAFGGCLATYHWALYIGLLTTTRLQNNIANYLWPLLLFIATWFMTYPRKRLDMVSVGVLGIGFLGAVSLVGFDKSPADIKFGLLAAGLATGYMAVAQQIVTRQTISVLSLWKYGLIISCVISGIAVVWTRSYPTLLELPKCLALTLALGVISVAIAQVLWTSSTTTSTTLTPYVLMYFTPLLSTLWQTIYLGDRVPANLFFGSIFILYASLVLLKFYRATYSMISMITVWLYCCFIIFFRADLKNYAISQNLAIIPDELLGILAGFFLSRQWQRSREEELSLSNWSSKLQRLTGLLLEYGSSSSTGKFREPIKHYVLNISTSAVNLDQAGDAKSFSQALCLFQSTIDGLEVFVRNAVHGSSSPTGEDCNVVFSEFKSEVNKWIALKSDKAEFSELAALVCLGSVFILNSLVAVLKIPMVSGMEALSHIVIPSVIAFVVVRVIEYNSRPSINKLSTVVQMQSSCRRLSIPYYVGDISKIACSPREFRSLAQRVRYFDGNAVFEADSVDFSGKLLRYLKFRELRTILLCVFPVIATVLALRV